MALVTPFKAIDIISQADDQAGAIVKLIGNLDDIEIIGDLVLLATAIAKEKTKSGIILPTTALVEDVYQGKVGLVLKCGPDAFRDENGDLYPQRFEVGDWGVYKGGDAWSLTVRGVPCRLCRDVALRMKVKDPANVF